MKTTFMSSGFTEFIMTDTQCHVRRLRGRLRGDVMYICVQLNVLLERLSLWGNSLGGGLVSGLTGR